jgi:hypothetical protein
MKTIPETVVRVTKLDIRIFIYIWKKLNFY